MNNFDDFNLKIALDLEKKYGKDLLDLDKCVEIHKRLLDEKTRIENELNISNEQSLVGKVIKNCTKFTLKCQNGVEKAQSLVESIKEDLNDVSNVRKEIKLYQNKINALQTALQYIKVVKHVEQLSSELERETRKEDDEKCATLFANLTEISRNLIDFKGAHLKAYLKQTIHYWHQVLKENFAKQFDDILKAIKWPFTSTNFSMVVPLASQVQKLQTIAEYLLQIEIPSESANPAISSALLSNFPTISLPVELLLQPLRKRFVYHFCGARQTNRVDKPEWYFTQILTWVRDHKEFVGSYIQPVVDKMGFHHIDAKLEFIRGLVEITVEKLNSELANLQYDDFVFSHTIDEALSFDKELRETYDYPSNQPSILAVLTQSHVFVKWIAMEKKFATKKMDAMLPPNAPDAFEPLTEDIEDLKVTTCADAFITLLHTITERYEALPQPGHKLQFLDLQLELLDDFRVRLLQLVNAEVGNCVESKIPAIVNTVFYIENVLIDWGAMLHYLYLYHYKSQLKTVENLTRGTFNESDDGLLPIYDNDTVFAEILSLYRHMRNDLLLNLAETVFIELKRSSRHYRHESWFMMEAPKELNSCSLTPSACAMFEILSKRLHQLKKSLQSKLFTFVWRLIAQQLDNYLFEDLIMDNRFNESGARQLKFDMTRNLVPLFAQFCEKPQNYFAQVIEACNLLNVTRGTAMLLTIEEEEEVDEMRDKALKEMGVNHLTPTMALKVLNRRVDISGSMTHKINSLS